MNTWFLANEVLIQNILVYSLLAISIQVSLRAGVFSVTGVGCWAIGAYTVAILTLEGVPIIPSVLLALVICGVVSWLMALILVRLRGLYLGMATFAFVLMVGVIALNGGDLTGGATGLFGIPLGVNTWQLFAIVGVVAVLLTALERGSLGRSFVIAREDEELAQALAMDTAKMRRFAFIVSGILGGLGGALHVLLIGSVAPTDAGFALIVLGLTMVIIGGFHSWVGALIGAALIQWMPIGLQSFTSSWSIVYGALVIVVAIYAPAGILGIVQSLYRQVRKVLGNRTGGVPTTAERGDTP